jgi:hypothetical protein
MRATERLVEVIAEEARGITDDVDAGGSVDALVVAMHVAKIAEATDELRRRGDTLVGGRDLERLLQVIGREHVPLGEDEVKALARLHHTLGGEQ